MRHRFTKVLLGLVLFTMLAGTATVAARSHKSTASYNVGIVYSRTGLLSSSSEACASATLAMPA